MRKAILLFFLTCILSCHENEQNVNVQFDKSKDGIVSSGQPLASKAGIEMMR